MTKPKPKAQNAPSPSSSPTTTPPTTAPTPKAAPRVIENVVPNLTPEAIDTGRWYWCGALPEAPQACIDCAGIGFPQSTETLRRRNAMGNVERTRQAGVVVRLTDAKLELLALRLRYKVVRPLRGNAGAAAETGAGQVLDEAPINPVRGVVLSIPTPEDEAAAKLRNRRIERFVPRAGDRPLADFIYLVPLDEPNPRPRPIDTPLPQPIAVTGIRFGTGSVEEGTKAAGTDDGYDAINAKLKPKSRSMLREIDERENATARLLE
jgi:hypothetical protein